MCVNFQYHLLDCCCIFFFFVPDPCIPNPCQFGGSCARGASTTVPSFVCLCPSGLTGSTCNSCDSNPCLNQGICTASTQGYSCTCPNGFEGDQCQTNMCDSSPCLNGGICQGVSGGYQCNCISGFTGDRCQESKIFLCIFVFVRKGVNTA